MMNRLGKEKSPYLLQHAENPVDWYAWGEEAFEKAGKEDKPIFLSIGYSTCHWCHVMEHESFEDPATAEVLNHQFVSIKVDREERPDIDSIYMNYVMATTGSGGWPMSVFLTPEKKPFYGGTYFPPENRYGMPGFKSLLDQIAEAWKNRRSEILKSADSAVRFLREQKVKGELGELGVETLKQSSESYASSFDPEWGGFGHAPKFPRSPQLSSLLRYWVRSGKDDKVLEMVEKTLKAMAKGGMYDQLGGGFHRYSTDAQWRVPHFEKMLYDQALLGVTYLEAYQATHDKFYAQIARETLDYVLREMTSSEGGFTSAQDADSADPRDPSKHREGAYYVWEASEIVKALGLRDAEIFSFHYGIMEKGNALSDPHGEFEGRNTLYEVHTIEETTAQFKMVPREVETSLVRSKKILFNWRSSRPRPHLDDKILTDWNGLMIYAFSFASRVLNEPRYRDAAVKAGEFLSTRLKDKKGNLLHRYRDGEAGIAASLNDYAFLIHGCLGLYEATFDEKWLEEARAAADKMIGLFWDERDGGFFLTSSDAADLIMRPKELYDGAVPSGNSLAALNLLRLERITTNKKYREFADRALDSFSGEIAASSIGYPQMLIALDFAIGPASEIVIAGEATDPRLGPIANEIYSRFTPNKIVILHKAGAQGRLVETLAPFTKEQKPLDGNLTVYVCRDYACKLPVTDVEALGSVLDI